MSEKPNIYIGLSIMYFITMFTIFIISPIQQTLGMWGLVITQLLFLAISISLAIILKWNLREVFPFKKPMIRQIFGTIIFWIGTFFIAIIASMILITIIPNTMAETSNLIGGLIRSIPLPLALIIVAVSPAICEEFLHRGLLLHTFKNVNNKWISISVLGLIFGLFHLNLPQLVPTALLGAVMAYIMIETKNMWLPILFHFINNAISVLVSWNVQATDASEALLNTNLILLSIGMWLVFCTGVPFLFIWGSKLLRTKEENKTKKLSGKALTLATVLSISSFVIGIGTMVLAILNGVLAEFMPVTSLFFPL
jgi:hypothetical protein